MSSFAMKFATSSRAKDFSKTFKLSDDPRIAFIAVRAQNVRDRNRTRALSGTGICDVGR